MDLLTSLKTYIMPEGLEDKQSAANNEWSDICGGLRSSPRPINNYLPRFIKLLVKEDLDRHLIPEISDIILNYVKS